MHADERSGVEAAFETGDGLLLKMFFALRGERDVVVLGFGVVEFGDGDESDAGAVFYDDAFEKLLRRASGGGEVHSFGESFAQAAFGAIESGFKAFTADGLEKIVDSVDFKGAHGELVVSCDENYGGVGVDNFEDVEAGEFGHLHVEENQIGFVRGNVFDGDHAVGAFGGDFNFRMSLQHFAENIARELFVIDDESFPGFARRLGHVGNSLSAGRSMST